MPNYSRYFIILQEDERSFAYSQDKLPSGYAKLENKNNKCRITFYVQNLSKEKKPYSYAIICGKKGKKQILNLGLLNIDDNGRCETTAEYGENNIGNMGIPMKEIVGAAIIKTAGPSIISVMSGFLSTNISDWKSYSVLDIERTSDKNEFEIYEDKIEKVIEEDLKPDIPEEIENTDKFIPEVPEMPEVLEMPELPEMPETMDIPEEIEKEPDLGKEFEEETEPEKPNPINEFEIEIDSSYSYFNDILCDFEEVEVCPEIERMKFFKIPVKSMDDMINCEDYNKYTVIYYPAINYYPYIKEYGYYLFALKFNKNGKLKYIAYAVPGENESKCQPYGGRSGFVTWVSEDGSDTGNGYWFMFYDFKNNTIVVPVR